MSNFFLSGIDTSHTQVHFKTSKENVHYSTHSVNTHIFFLGITDSVLEHYACILVCAYTRPLELVQIKAVVIFSVFHDVSLEVEHKALLHGQS